MLRQVIDRFGGLTADIKHTATRSATPEHRVKSVQLGDDEAVVVFDPANPQHRDLIRALLTTAPKVYTYSAPADLNPLIHAGLTDDTLWDHVRDTLIVTRLADPATTGSRTGLKSVSPIVLGSAAVIPRADAARAELFGPAEAMAISEIARVMGVARNTVKTALATGEPPQYRRAPRESLADPIRTQ